MATAIFDGRTYERMPITYTQDEADRLLAKHPGMTQEHISMWADSFEGVIPRLDLERLLVKTDDDRAYYRCLCGWLDHYMTRLLVDHEGEDCLVVHCWEHKLQWFTTPYPNASRVAGIIRGEEARYLKLLKRAPATLKKFFRHRAIDGEGLSILWHTYGVDLDTSLHLLDREQDRELRAAAESAMDEHRKTGATQPKRVEGRGGT